MTNEKEVYGLYLGKGSVESDKPFSHDSTPGHARLSVIVFRDPNSINTPGSAIRNPSYTPFDHLEFSAWWDGNKSEGKTYGWQVTYRDIYSVDLREAERMTKMLRKASKVKMPIQPETFGQFAVLMAKALGIKKFVRNIDPDRWSSSYDEQKHAILDIRDGGRIIDEEIAKVQKMQKEVYA